jgi:hypothetical protein
MKVHHFLESDDVIKHQYEQIIFQINSFIDSQKI